MAENKHNLSQRFILNPAIIDTIYSSDHSSDQLSLRVKRFADTCNWNKLVEFNSNQLVNMPIWNINQFTTNQTTHRQHLPFLFPGDKVYFKWNVIAIFDYRRLYT